MPEQRHQNPERTIDGYEPAVFGGFERPDANFVFTPNQYLDLCIPHASRGCARLVGYMLRHLIGWRDADGNPLYEKVEVTQRELERRANVGKSSINAALAEAESLGFILCVTRGRPNTLGEGAVQNAWALRWDDSGHYADALQRLPRLLPRRGASHHRPQPVLRRGAAERDPRHREARRGGAAAHGGLPEPHHRRQRQQRAALLQPTGLPR